jgi:signal transduction histidine kinase
MFQQASRQVGDERIDGAVDPFGLQAGSPAGASGTSPLALPAVGNALEHGPIGAHGADSPHGPEARSCWSRRLGQQVAIVAGTAPDLEDALGGVLDLVGAVVGATRGEAFLIDAAGGIEPIATGGDRSRRDAQATLGGLAGLLPLALRQEGVSWFADLAALPQELRGQLPAELLAGGCSALGVVARIGARPVAALFFVASGDSPEWRVRTAIDAAVKPLGEVIERRRLERELLRERRLLEVRLRERSEECRHLYEQFRDAEQWALVGSFSGGLLHDLTNVLLPLQCQVDMLRGVLRRAEDLAHLDALESGLNYLRELTRNVHALSRDPRRIVAGRCSLARWWRQAAPLLRSVLPPGATLESSVPRDLPLVGIAANALTQAILNLVANSAAALGSAGRIRIAASATADGMVELRVEDDGGGMPEAIRRRVFEPFYTTRPRQLGTGLGLSIVRGVVEGAGGSIEIDSAPGRGTLVTLRLPAVGRGGAGKARGPSGALLSIDDRRLAGFARQILLRRGVRLLPEARQRHADLWVLEPNLATPAAVSRFLAGPSPRRVLLLGETKGPWQAIARSPSVARLEDSTDVVEFKRQLDQIILELSGA